MTDNNNGWDDVQDDWGDNNNNTDKKVNQANENEDSTDTVWKRSEGSTNIRDDNIYQENNIPQMKERYLIKRLGFNIQSIFNGEMNVFKKK